MNKKIFVLPIFCIFLTLASCKKDTIISPEPAPAPVTPKNDTSKNTNVSFDFKAFVGSVPLIENAWYLNFQSDSFTVFRLNYYISNIKFKKADGSVFSESESYHLNKHLDGKETFCVSGVPEGNYTAIEFIIGVDSTRNVSGVQSGDLAIEQDMFWDWNTGYIFFKIEGAFKNVRYPMEENFGVHIGGFSGESSCVRKASFVLKDPLIVKKGVTNKIFYHLNIQEIFENPEQIDFEMMNAGGARILPTIADNYTDMFKVDHITN